MKALSMNRRLVLEAPELLSDGAGGYRVNWIVLGQVWADVTARTGREGAQASIPVSRMGYAITVRSAPIGSPQRPEPKQRFRDGLRVFNIETVADRDAYGRYLICIAQEEVVV